MSRGKPPRPTEALLLGVIGWLSFVGALEILPRTGIVSPQQLPPFSAMVGALADEASTGAFWLAFLDTIQVWALGLAIAVAAGTASGIVIGSVRFLREATASTIEFLRPIPSVAWIPLVVLLYGASMRGTLLLVVYASFWPVLVQVLHGVEDVDPVARDTALAYRFGAWARVRHVVVPTALPYMLTGVRLAAGVALILTITGELFIGSPGLGNQVNLAREGGAVATAYALVIVIGTFSVCVNIAFRALERRALAWHTSVRGELAV